MIKQGTYVLHADEGGAIVAKIGLESTIITSDYEGEESESYQVPTYYLELLFNEVVE